MRFRPRASLSGLAALIMLTGCGPVSPFQVQGDTPPKVRIPPVAPPTGPACRMVCSQGNPGICRRVCPDLPRPPQGLGLPDLPLPEPRERGTWAPGGGVIDPPRPAQPVGAGAAWGSQGPSQAAAAGAWGSQLPSPGVAARRLPAVGTPVTATRLRR